jgi:putative ABC transport system substrate-binding protein
MKRQAFMLLGAAAAAWPLAARRQQKVAPVVGWLLVGPAPLPGAPFAAALRQGLSEAGYVDGQNLRIEERAAEGRLDRLPALAADLVGRKVDLIVAGADPAASAAKNATSSIPIVFNAGGDPVRQGVVDSLARPGGNLTGVSFLAADLNPKRLELLSELVPQARVIALLMNPTTNIPVTERSVRDLQEAARPNGLQLQILKASTESEIDAAFASLVQWPADALIVFSDPFLYAQRERIMAAAARHAVPAIYDFPDYARAGGLISYGASLTAIYRQIGIYAGKILKGAAKPADLPVVRPSTFELVINAKAAKAFSLTIPPNLLARADEVIE